VLTGPRREAPSQTRQVLAAFLDRMAAAPTASVDALAAISNEYRASCEMEARFDWRYYMVKYPSMRQNGSSTYFAEHSDDT
jgi:hypothetical protein